MLNINVQGGYFKLLRGDMRKNAKGKMLWQRLFAVPAEIMMPNKLYFFHMNLWKFP